MPFIFTDRKHGFSKFTIGKSSPFLKQLVILYGDKYRHRLFVARSKV